MDVLIQNDHYTGVLKFKRRFIYPLRWFYQSHIMGMRFRLRYVRIFASAVWHWDSCDYAGTLRLMEIAFREIARLHSDHGHMIDSSKVARQTLIAASLCRRLEQDEYADLAGYPKWEIMNEFQRYKWAKHTEYLADQDVRYLQHILKHLRKWWQ